MTVASVLTNPATVFSIDTKIASTLMIILNTFVDSLLDLFL